MAAKMSVLVNGKSIGVGISILLAAAALRLPGLGGRSLWLDEAYSVWQAGRGHLTIWVTDRDPVHSGLYYSLLHPWLHLGQEEFWVRLPSVWASLLMVALVWLLGRRLAGAAAGRWAALLLAVSPLDVWYAQEARMYALLAMSGVLWAVALTWARSAGPTVGFFRWWTILPLAVFFSLGLYLDLPMILLWGGLSGIWLADWWQRGRDPQPLFIWLIGSFSGALLSWPVWSFVPPWIQAIEARLLFPLWFWVGLLFVGPLTGGWVIFFLGSRLLGDAAGRRWLLFLSGLLFICLVLWMLWPQLALFKRLAVLFWPYLVLCTAVMFNRYTSRSWLIGLASLALLVTLLGQWLVPKDDWRGVVAYLNDAAAPGDLVWLSSVADRLPYIYYQPIHPFQLGGVAQLQERGAAAPTIWLITSYGGDSALKAWLNENRTLAGHIPFYRIDIWQYSLEQP